MALLRTFPGDETAPMKSIAIGAFALVLLLPSCSTTSARTSPEEHAAGPAAEQHDAAPLTEQHAWLRRFEGEWRSEATIEGAPGEPPQTMGGTERARSVGGRWIVSDFRGATPAGDMEAVLTLGYDAGTGRFVGTWIDSIADHLWVYEGTLDPDGEALTLESRGPSFAGDGTLANYRDVFRFEGRDRKVLTSSMQGADGTWTTYLTVDYRRTK